MKPNRRFTDPGTFAPERVKGLAANHDAVTEGRTLFSTTVVDPTDSPRLLVSGVNQKKIGDRVTKGPWKGMPIFTLTLEERATCPKTCHHWRTCYGNGMPLARRHKHGDALIDGLHEELHEKAKQHPGGFVVRLHILGDFYSRDYVAEWARWLGLIPQLHVFGYTAHLPRSPIGQSIARLNRVFRDRWAIRWSSETEGFAANTLWHLASGRVPEGVVCPAQTHENVCCGACGLCWSPEMRDTPIAFMAHGRKSKV